MDIIDEKGRIFGIFNILDVVILSFVLILVASLFLYTKFPPKFKEHKDVVFQMYFADVPYAVGKQVFVLGTPLIATYAKQDKAVIIAVREVISNYTTGYITFLITINASLEIDGDGDLLFNGNDVAPGNIHDVQIGTSYFQGKIWRVDYNHDNKTKEVTVVLDQNYLPGPSPGERVFDKGGNEIGMVIDVGGAINTTVHNREHFYITLSLNGDVYDNEFFVSELPIRPFFPLSFIAGNNTYTGDIVGVFQ